MATTGHRVALDPGIEQLLNDIDPNAPGLDALPIDEIREAVADMVDWMGPVLPVDHVEDRLIAGPAGNLPVRIYRNDTDQPGPLVLLTHGGGWLSGSIDISDRPARVLTREGGGVVVSVEYRLAPEHPYPAGLEDAYSALRWAVEAADELGADPDFVAVAGDSSGGNLAAALTLVARDRGGPRIDHQLLMYPVLDRDFTSASYREFADGYFLTKAQMEHFWRLYLPLESGPGAPPYAAPLQTADLSGLPAATILQCAADPLFSEGHAYGQRLAAAGVPVVATRFDGLIHGALWMAGLSPLTKAFAELAGFSLRLAHASSS